MNKCRDIADILAEEYNEKRVQQCWPRLKLHTQKGNGEGYNASCGGGVVELIADSPVAMTHALADTTTALRAGQLAEFLGDMAPRFALRPLWLRADCEVAATAHLTLHLPEWLASEKAPYILPQLCRRLLTNGFNSILLGSSRGAFSAKAPAPIPLDITALFDQFAEHGIILIVKPNFLMPPELRGVPKCPYDSSFASFLCSASVELLPCLPPNSYFFWESMLLFTNYRFHTEAQEATEAELVSAEVRLLEKALQKEAKLIFYLPSPDGKIAKKQSKWIPQLLDDMGTHSILAFNCVEGELCGDHSPDHPLWSALRNAKDCSKTALLPIANLGLAKQGEGLWPTTNLDLIERFVTRLGGHNNFAGIVTTVSQLPAEGSLLDNMLWVAGHSLWHSLPGHLLAETWFRAHCPAEEWSILRPLLMEARQLSLEISEMHTIAIQKGHTGLQASEGRACAEMLLAGLKNLQRKSSRYFAKKVDSPFRTELEESFALFANDIKWFVDYFLQYYRIPAFNLLCKEERGDGCWLSPNSEGSLPRSWLLDHPMMPQAGTPANLLFTANRLF